MYEEDERKKHNTRMKLAEEKGWARGIVKGMKQGIEQRNIDIAKNLLNQNVDINIISTSTGLSIEDINRLK